MIRYVVIEEHFNTPELGRYRTYGIRAEDEYGKIRAQVSDVSLEPEFVEILARACTEGELSPEQLHDVVLNSI